MQMATLSVAICIRRQSLSEVVRERGKAKNLREENETKGNGKGKGSPSYTYHYHPFPHTK